MPDAGRVHIFRRLGTAPHPHGESRWVETASIEPPNPRSSMWFGSAIAWEGDLIAIASPGDDVPTRRHGEVVQSAGAVYLYRRIECCVDESERYLLERVLTAPTPEHAAWFGMALDLDGGLLAVGVPRARDLRSRLEPRGCVYLFDLSKPDVTPTRIDPPPGAATVGFGQALSLRGETLVIGAPSTDRDADDGLPTPLDDAGAAWVYSLSSGRAEAELNPPRPLPSGLFGASCALARIDVPTASDPGDASSAVDVALVGHRFTEEESIAPSPGAGLFFIPTPLRHGSLWPPDPAPP